MKCDKCGAGNPNAAKTCVECGASMRNGAGAKSSARKKLVAKKAPKKAARRITVGTKRRSVRGAQASAIR